MTETTDAVRAALDPDHCAAFEARVGAEAAALQRAIREGAFDASHFAVGLELEGYVVDGAGRLATAPERLFDTDGCSRELGVHNAELHTDPDVVSGAGLRRQFEELRATHRNVRAALEDDGLDFVLDAMWTREPEMGSLEYLEVGEETDGVFLSTHMRTVPRYIALDQEIRRRNGGVIEMDLPGLSETSSMLVESLATSMQPHLQVPDPDDIPAYLNVATRTMGPILSLTANSPFLPADRYESDLGSDVLDRTPHELRVPIFERSVEEGSSKCRLPRDVDSIDAVIDRMADDPTLVAVPDLIDEHTEAAVRSVKDSEDVENDADEAADGDDADEFSAFAAKRGTYWRWVRPVFGGDIPRDPDGEHLAAADRNSVRLEYRPLPTQPTLRDTVGVQALVVGVLRGVDVADHPLAELPWEDARASFYAAVDDGPDADLHWVTADGDATTTTADIYDELFSLARRGLTAFGVDAASIDWALDPIEARRQARFPSPSAWKRARARDARREGASLPDAIREMQAAYVDRAADGVPFAEW
ncbi:MAG: hypothetical protein ABEI27_12685 [Halobellus sp.]|uniref:hypothetical protein n=1 Tax=Halobellus sp. TaxID=1979212 RepID=UPI0035D469DF